MTKEQLIDEFKRIRVLGFVESKRSHDTGIGKTFEEYMNIPENNKSGPDIGGFEIKSQRDLSKSYITLFTKKPSHPKGANRFLKDNFGKPDSEHLDVKVLHTSIFGDRFNTFNNEFGFKMLVDDVEEKLILQVKRLDTDEIISDGTIFWHFKHVEGKKLENSLFVFADIKKENGIEYFHYTKAKMFLDFSFSKLIDGFKKGYIMFDIRIGAYKTGRMKGKPHDHGSGFRVKRENLKDLFENYLEIE